MKFSLFSAFKAGCTSIFMLAMMCNPLAASIPASYDRLFREQENHIQSLEEQMTALSFELDKERSQSVELRGVSEKYAGLSASYDKLKIAKTKLQKEAEKNKHQVKDLKKYYVLEQKESDLREKRVLKASARLADTLRQRESQIDDAEKQVLALTKELKSAQVKHTKLSREYQEKYELAGGEKEHYKVQFDKLKEELIALKRSSSIKGQELEQVLIDKRDMSGQVSDMKKLLVSTRQEAQKAFSVRIEALQKKFKSSTTQAMTEKTRREDLEKQLGRMTQTKEATDTLLQASLKEKGIIADHFEHLKNAMAETVGKYNVKSEEFEKKNFILDTKTREVVQLQEELEKSQKGTAEILRDNKVLLARRKNFDSILATKDQEVNQLISTKKELQSDVSRLQIYLKEVMADREKMETTSFSATKVADLSDQLTYANKSLENVRQRLAREKQDGASRIEKYQTQLASLSGELNQARIEYANLDQKRSIKGQSDWEELKGLRMKYNLAAAQLQRAEAESNKVQKMNVQIFAQLEEKNKTIEVMKSKTSQLLASLGLNGAQDRHGQQTTYFRKLIDRELAGLSIKELQEQNTEFSAGLRSLLKDSRLIGTMIDELGNQAVAGTKDGAKRCEQLHKVFLARKQMASGNYKEEHHLDQMFKMYAKFASKELGDKTLAQMSINDIGHRGNDLAAKIAENL